MTGLRDFISKELKECLSDQGTVLDEIPDYTPQLNGTANRNIRTATRSMLKAPDLLKYLWAEAMCAAFNTKNPFTSPNKSTPFELWFGHEPDISHFRIYGCKAYMHVPNQKRKPLDDRAGEWILVGYCTGSTYRLITKTTRRIEIARDVKFDGASRGLCNFKNDYEPLYLEYEDQEVSSTREEDKKEKKEVVDIEEHKISAGTDMGAKPAFGVRRSASLQGMREAKEREDKSLDELSEIETHFHHSSHQQDAGEESSQVYTITSGPNRESSSKMLLHIIPRVLLRMGIECLSRR